MRADHGETTLDLPSLALAQVLNLLGDVLPVEFIACAPTQGVSLVLGPFREVALLGSAVHHGSPSIKPQ